MEFPELGKRCGLPSCKTLDFLPVMCNFCNETFCKEHAETSKHNCENAVDKIVSEKTSSDNFKCSADQCRTSDPVEMNCIKCNKHFCLQHRHHGCFDTSSSLSKREKQRLPKEMFKKAKAETDAMIQEKLKKAKNRSLANKVKLMKVKSSAVGLNTVPTNNRLYFLVAPPLGSSGQSKARALFGDKTWTVGKTIDFLSKKLHAENTNNIPDGPQLRLFSSGGDIISDDLAVILQDLLEDGTLVDGDSLILEFITPDQLSQGSNIFVEERCLGKYSFI